MDEGESLTLCDDDGADVDEETYPILMTVVTIPSITFKRLDHEEPVYLPINLSTEESSMNLGKEH